MVHRINVFLLSISLVIVQIFTMNQALAGAAEKWELVENVYDKSKNTVNVTAKKIGQQAANSGSYKVQVPVSASDLGGTVKRMLWAGVAISAVTALVNGVGWIIDTGSKTIKKPKDTSPDLPTFEYVWTNGYDSKYYQSSFDAASAFLVVLKRNNSDLIRLGSLTIVNINQVKYDVVRTNGSSYSQYISVNRTKNPKYNPAQEPQFDIISDSQLGNEILGNGTEPNSKPTPVPEIITSAYSPNNPVSDAPAPKATNDALNSANPQPEKEPDGKSETEKEKDENGVETGKETSKFQLPNFCEWAPSVCDFFTVQKQDNKEIKENQKLDTEQNKTFFDSVKEWFDWTKEDANYPDSQEVEIDKTIPVVPNTSYFSWGAYCPFTAGSQTISIENTSAGIDYDLTSWCELASDIRPFVLAAGALMSFLIAAGVVMGRDD